MLYCHIIFGEDFTREHFLGLFYDENGVPLTAKINDKLGYKICLGNSEYDATPLLIAINITI